MLFHNLLYWLEFGHEDFLIKCYKLVQYKFSKYNKVIHFSVDGPGGEVINAIGVDLEYYTSERVPSFYKDGALESFNVGFLCSESAFGSALINIYS